MKMVEIDIKLKITPVQYMRADNLARTMKMPMDKALGLTISGHMDSILANTHVEAPAGPKPIDWGAFK